MILNEFYMTRRDGVRLVRTYSDLNMMISRDGVLYEEAIDPEELGRVYEETDIPIERHEPIPGPEYEVIENAEPEVNE